MEQNRGNAKHHRQGIQPDANAMSQCDQHTRVTTGAYSAAQD